MLKFKKESSREQRQIKERVCAREKYSILWIARNRTSIIIGQINNIGINLARKFIKECSREELQIKEREGAHEKRRIHRMAQIPTNYIIRAKKYHWTRSRAKIQKVVIPE